MGAALRSSPLPALSCSRRLTITGDVRLPCAFAIFLFSRGRILRCCCILSFADRLSAVLLYFPLVFSHSQRSSARSRLGRMHLFSGCRCVSWFSYLLELVLYQSSHARHCIQLRYPFECFGNESEMQSSADYESPKFPRTQHFTSQRTRAIAYASSETANV